MANVADTLLRGCIRLLSPTAPLSTFPGAFPNRAPRGLLVRMLPIGFLLLHQWLWVATTHASARLPASRHSSSCFPADCSYRCLSLTFVVFVVVGLRWMSLPALFIGAQFNDLDTRRLQASLRNVCWVDRAGKELGSSCTALWHKWHGWHLTQTLRPYAYLLVCIPSTYFLAFGIRWAYIGAQWPFGLSQPRSQRLPSWVSHSGCCCVSWIACYLFVYFHFKSEKNETRFTAVLLKFSWLMSRIRLWVFHFKCAPWTVCVMAATCYWNFFQYFCSFHCHYAKVLLFLFWLLFCFWFQFVFSFLDILKINFIVVFYFCLEFLLLLI